MKRVLAVMTVGLLVALGGCKAKHTYPEPAVGWHTNDFSTIFGRLLRVRAKNPDDPPVWVIRYGLPSDTYGGQLALTPPNKMIGYGGGEMVEVHGVVRLDLGHPDYTGTWYEVHGVKLWENYH